MTRTRSFPRLAVVALLAAMLPAGGCFWLAVGGAGYTGYEIAEDDRTISTKANDASITSSVKTMRAVDPEVDAIDINVDTYAGAMTLHRHVESDRERAIALVGRVKGVSSVTSNLVVVGR
jgi:osmotically-inducible protein OsmY